MRRNDIEVPARYYTRLIEMLELSGLNVQPLLARARISLSTLQNPDVLLRYSQVERLITLVREASGRSDLGFELGRTLTMSTHSMVGFGMLSSANMEQSLQFVARFFRLVMPSFGMCYTKGQNQAAIDFFPLIGMGPHSLSFHIEAIATAAYREISEMCRNIPRYRIALSMDQPKHIGRYRELDQVQWIFQSNDKPGIRIHFDFNLAHYPLAMADTNALSVAEQRCNLLLKSVASKGRFKDWVQMTLRETDGGFASLADLSAFLNVSPRTLDRHLKREGTGFRQLTLEIRHEMACNQLKNDTLSITEIAYALGFSDAANFSRSFRAQTGCSPREFRAKALGSNPANVTD